MNHNNLSGGLSAAANLAGGLVQTGTHRANSIETWPDPEVAACSRLSVCMRDLDGSPLNYSDLPSRHHRDKTQTAVCSIQTQGAPLDAARLSCPGTKKADRIRVP